MGHPVECAIAELLCTREMQHPLPSSVVSCFDRLCRLSAPAAAFRSKPVKCVAWGVGLCPPCCPGCLLCCGVWGARLPCSWICSFPPLAAADSCSCCPPM